MKGKRRRSWERIKTLLILVLSCSAVYLAGRTFFPGQLGGLFARPLPAEPASPGTALLSSQTLRPAALAVTRKDGRYGLLYHQDDQEAVTQASSLLAQALTGVSTPRTVTRQVWLQALSEPGLFCQYLAPMPLDALSRWLSGREEPHLSQAWAQRLCITARSLYFQGEGEVYYVCDLANDLTPAFSQLAEQFSVNGAHFAGESDKYPHLRADSLILSLAPRLPQLLAENPITLSDPSQPSEALSSLLQTLSFHPQTNPLYPVTGGWAITDGGETLRIDPQGQLTYRRSDQTALRFPADEPVLDATRALAEATVGALGGDARLYLQQVRQDGEETVVTYGYAYRGAAIQTGEEGWCAQFTVKDGCVDSFTLVIRRYTAQDAQALLLPQEQAAAALNAGSSGQALELLYEDLAGPSQELTPFWAVRAEGR